MTGSRLQVSGFGLAVLFVCGMFLSGCAATSRGYKAAEVSASDYISLEDFCGKHGLEYQFDTIDDVIRVFSSEKEVKVLLNSVVGSADGTVFYLKKAPVYFKGEILLPRQLEKIVFSKDFAVFKPLFSVDTIVIDPGHGGKDPGAVSACGLYEKTVNLAISKYLKDRLEKEGFKVFLTREKDVYLSLQDRVDIAKKRDADLFVSIHANSNRSKKVSGVEVYHLSPTQLNSHERSIKLAKSEDFKGKDISCGAKAILWDLLITKNYSFSVEFSNILYFNFKNLGFKVKPPKKAPFYVLRYACTPSVLVEAGYLSNHYEEKALRRRHYQKQIAEGVALSIMSLKNRYANAGSDDNGLKERKLSQSK